MLRPDGRYPDGMNDLRSARVIAVLLFAGASLASAQIADPTKTSPSGAGAETVDGDVASARAAAARLRSGASEAAVRVQSVPVEFAPILRVMGYAGEVAPGLDVDPAAALSFKASYWSRQRAALVRRAAALAARERTDREDSDSRVRALGDSRFDRGLALEEVVRASEESAHRQSERQEIESSLRRIDAVLADIKADQAGADDGQGLIARKAALMRRLSRS